MSESQIPSKLREGSSSTEAAITFDSSSFSSEVASRSPFEVENSVAVEEEGG